MRTFILYREEDVSGVSGIGIVAEGIEFSDGRVAIRWRGNNCSTAIWDNVEDVLTIHGHNGKTKVIWLSESGPASSDLTDTLLNLSMAAVSFILAVESHTTLLEKMTIDTDTKLLRKRIEQAEVILMLWGEGNKK